MTKRSRSKTKYTNLFASIDPDLTADEFVFKYKKAIIRSNRLMRLFYQQYNCYLYMAARKMLKLFPLLELHALVHEGFEGMLKALKKYDNSYASFLTYAQYWIYMMMRAYAHRNASPIQLPSNVYSLLERYKRLLQEQPRRSDEYYAGMLNISLKRLHMIKQAAASQLYVKSLELLIEVNDFEDANEEVLPAPSLLEVVFTKVTSDNLIGILKKLLTDKEYYVISSLFGLEDGCPKVLERVGKVLGVSKERVRQIKEGAFTKLRESEAIREYI